MPIMDVWLSFPVCGVAIVPRAESGDDILRTPYLYVGSQTIHDASLGFSDGVCQGDFASTYG